MPNRKPKLWLDEDTPFVPNLTVYETAPEPVDTGLLDASGTKIFRTPQREPVGFDLRRTGGKHG
jgi:hypothetical protein